MCFQVLEFIQEQEITSGLSGVPHHYVGGE